MEEYYKEMYAIAIDEYYIYCKCPFTTTNKIHKFPNKTSSLLNRDEVVDCDCDICGDKIVVNIGDYTNRVSIKENKRQTSFNIDKSSTKRIRLLHNLEIEGRRQFNKTPHPQ